MPAEAQSADCPKDGSEPVRIAAVDSDFTLHLVDGRMIMLAGIDPARDTPTRPAFAREAAATLSHWLEGRDVKLTRLTADEDRWGRWPGLLFATRDEPAAAPFSASFALVDAGLARVRPNPALHACWPALLGAEAAARAQKLGLWADPDYAILHPGDTGALAAAEGRMALVEGQITRVGHGRQATYLGLDGPRTGFALRIDRRNRDVLAALGLDRDRLIGVRVRARGVLDDRFGPAIAITDGDQIEVLQPGDGGSANAGGR